MENKETTCITENPIWQKGYESAIKDLRVALAPMYNRDKQFAIRDIIMYLYRDIDFKNLYDWRIKNLWTSDNY